MVWRPDGPAVNWAFDICRKYTSTVISCSCKQRPLVAWEKVAQNGPVIKWTKVRRFIVSFCIADAESGLRGNSTRGLCVRLTRTELRLTIIYLKRQLRADVETHMSKSRVFLNLKAFLVLTDFTQGGTIKLFFFFLKEWQFDAGTNLACGNNYIYIDVARQINKRLKTEATGARASFLVFVTFKCSFVRLCISVVTSYSFQVASFLLFFGFPIDLVS